MKPHFLKLHYPRRLSRFTRRLRRPVIGLHLWVADELERIGVPFLPEVGGGVFGRDPRESWGFLLRELSPTGARCIPPTVPLFALYGRDYHAAGHPTLLEQLVLASGESPEGYLTQHIVRPMVRLWLEVVHRTGCALELHGQNTLFTFSAATWEGSIVYRDCAVYVDPAIRKELSLGPHLPEVNVISRDILFAREEVFSLTYDSFMGHHALAYIASAAHRRWGIRPEVLHAAAKDQFAELSSGASLLPDTVFYYDGALRPDGKWELVDTGRAPAWR
ncbi:MAG TPA: IucA/IucC family C-terminal-domain containing protein [Actinomycetota bacterium]